MPAPRWRRPAGVLMLLALGAVLGAYLGGGAVEACTAAPAGGPVGSCDTDLRLSPVGAAVGALVVALLAALLSRRER